MFIRKALEKLFNPKGLLLNSIITGTWASIIAAYLLNQVTSTQLMFFSLAFASILSIPHLLTYLLRMFRGEVRTASSYNAIISKLPGSLTSLIGDISKPKTIYILGGMLTEFVRNTEMLTALKLAHATREVDIRILMLDPRSDAINTVTRDRIHRKSSLAQDLRRECLDSILRLAGHLGWPWVESNLRIYSSIPHSAVHKLGDHYIITTYSFGRGGSSPALYIHRSEETKEYCDGLDSGFEDLWKNSKAAQSVTEELHKSMSREFGFIAEVPPSSRQPAQFTNQLLPAEGHPQLHGAIQPDIGRNRVAIPANQPAEPENQTGVPKKGSTLE